ncbi:Hypothetical protein, putative [Bodo saltans]|uniref:PDZ domain-containing protein n=1 Tax=Bodo saltans TaxID=75058 RepID=A0A0S4IM29_BODSA|nr:Hypothetical protein, putative [Bodo saltans]|eukprot:CUF36288.1 Hypothetical protein, putative [Bodo saltans]
MSQAQYSMSTHSISEPSCEQDVVTLQTFLHATSTSSATPSASPLALWQVVQALARTCVSLACPQAPLVGHSVIASRIDALSSLLSETVQRLSTVEQIMEKMHRRIVQQRDESSKNLADSEQARDSIEIKISTQIADVQRDLERLQHGVERHATYVDKILSASEERLGDLESQMLQIYSKEKLQPTQSQSVSTPATFGIAVKQVLHGVEVVSVGHCSRAHRSGLRPGDLILAIADQNISSVVEVGAILQNIAHRSGTFVTQIFRDERLHSIVCDVTD